LRKDGLFAEKTMLLYKKYRMRRKTAERDINNKSRDVQFWATAEQSKYIITKPLHHSQKIVSRNSDGSCIFSISVVLNFELYSMLLSYGSGVKVLSPRVAVHYMNEKIKEMAKHYDDEGNK
jgi:predicted DNA-binding transcriptional regulator YafY